MTAIDRLADGYEPNHDIDREVGKTGELFVARLIDSLRDGSVEVKTDVRAQDTGNVFIEYQCKRRGKYQPSGIATTQADVWTFVVGQVAISAPTELVREVARRNWRKPWRRKDMQRGSHPTRGVLIPVHEYLAQVLQMSPRIGGFVEVRREGVS